jgi:hypothetical protein
MFSITHYYHKSNPLGLSSSPLRFLNQRTLAVAMFLAFALLGIIGGKESNTQKSPVGSALMHDGVNRQNSTACPTATKPAKLKKSLIVSSWQSVERAGAAFRRAFNDPSLIEYANEQSTDIPDPPITSGSHADSKR